MHSLVNGITNLKGRLDDDAEKSSRLEQQNHDLG